MYITTVALKLAEGIFRYQIRQFINLIQYRQIKVSYRKRNLIIIGINMLLAAWLMIYKPGRLAFHESDILVALPGLAARQKSIANGMVYGHPAY